MRWTEFKSAIDRVLGPEEQRSDDMAGAIEFFGAGRGNQHSKPGQSFGHESIEDILKDSFKDAAIRKEIYFGNWLRDFSQAITPTTLLLFSVAADLLDKTLPGPRSRFRARTHHGSDGDRSCPARGLHCRALDSAGEERGRVPARRVDRGFYAHSNFCELALRAVGKTGVEPWTTPETRNGKTFFPW